MKVHVLKYLGDNAKGKPNEDFLIVTNNSIFAVGDGVTRFVPESKEYPNPSPARGAAKIFCTATCTFFDHYRKSGTRSSVDQIEESLRQIFELANLHLQAFNLSIGISEETANYLENDFAGCVGVLAVLVGKTLHYGYIGDCGLMVFDKNRLLVLITPNNLEALEQMRDAWGFVSEQEKKLFWRKTMRNHPEAPHLTYGVLNGEKQALSYVQIGHVNLKSGDTAVLFSDGMLPYLFAKRIREAIVDALRYIENRIQPNPREERYAVNEILKEAIGNAEPALNEHKFKNLDDDKALIAIQLV